MLLVSVPAAQYDTNTEPFADVARQLTNAAVLRQFNIPELRVGTLDSLMILDEELAKVDILAEQSINKLQRQYDDLEEADREAGGASLEDGNDGESGLLVQGVSPRDFLEQFAWDEARYSHSRRLNELVKMIQQSIGKIDDDMKALGQDYNETKQHLSSLLRKRSANLMVADLKDVLTKEVCLTSHGQTPQELFKVSSFMQAVPIVVPANLAEEFLASYWKLCDNVVSLRDGTSFSPVVPNSAVEVMRDDDGYVLFRVFVLKGVVKASATEEAEAEAEAVAAAAAAQAAAKEAEAAEAGDDEEAPAEGGATKEDAPAPVEQKQKTFLEVFSDACRQNRYLVKEYDPFALDEDEDADDAEGEVTLDAEIAKLQAERDAQKIYLMRRCIPYFEDVYVAWIHIKAIRVFVESVLRYGVPPQYHAGLLIPSNVKHMRKIRQVLEKTYRGLDRMDASNLNVSEDVQRILGQSSSANYLPYINIGVSFLD